MDMTDYNRRIRDVGVAMLVLAAMLFAAIFAFAQAPPTPPKVYTPTEIQALKLKVAQQDAQIAQRDLQAAQTRFQQALTDLQAQATAIEAANGWPKDVMFDPNTMTFSERPKDPAATVPTGKP